MPRQKESFFKYEVTKNFDTNTCSDWERFRASPGSYFIHLSPEITDQLEPKLKNKVDADGFIDLHDLMPGESIFYDNKADKQAEMKNAKKDQLIAFFKSYMLNKMTNEGEKNALAELMFLNFHQTGIQHLTCFAMFSAFSGQKTTMTIPTSIIKFTPTKQGISITEINTVKQILKYSKPVPLGNAEYHAKIETEMELTKDSVKLKRLDIDCKTAVATSLFDRRSILEWLIDAIRSFMSLDPIKESSEFEISLSRKN